MAQRKTLTEKQVAILRWIAEGCPEGGMHDPFHRISAAALRSRGLVNTSGRGPKWSAQATTEGRRYLEQVDGSDPPMPRQANVSVTEQLVTDVAAAGGSMRVPRRRWNDRTGVDYASRARLAERYGKVPSCKRLTVTAVDDQLELALVDAPDRVGGRGELVPIPVPVRVSRYHAAARDFRNRSDRHEVSRALLARVVRLVHAIATEAERRGWAANAPPDSSNAYGRQTWTGAKDGHLAITAGEHFFWLRIREEGVHTRGPWDEEVTRYRGVSRESLFYRDRDLPSGPYEATGTGRLNLELFAAEAWMCRGRQSRWGDRQSWALEDRLPHIFREVEERIIETARINEERRVAAERAAEAAQRGAEERERRWHTLMAQARDRFVEERRSSVLRHQIQAWHDADEIRRYCDAIEEAFGSRPETAEWVAWARAHADQLDPLTEPPRLPDHLEPTLDELQRHLPEGWSAQGPQDNRARHWRP